MQEESDITVNIIILILYNGLNARNAMTFWPY